MTKGTEYAPEDIGDNSNYKYVWYCEEHTPQWAPVAMLPTNLLQKKCVERGCDRVGENMVMLLPGYNVRS